MPPGLDVLKVAFVVTIVVFFSSTLPPATRAQDTVTGAFEGTISDSQTGTALKGALVEIINQQTNVVISLRADYRGRFYQGLLLPGIYRIRVSSPGYRTHEVLQRLKITYTGEVVPVPVALDPAPAGVVTPPAPAPVLSDTDIRASIITVDARRSGSFPAEEITSLPLGGTTLARTFDELALLLPGVAPPPQTLGSVAGPGVGAGVGSAGQFSVNGLRSRGNNFTVDGSDNNDEDIGVRRQGFVALIPQPIESVQEYQVITLLAPAQFGRNLGGQVNAVSKSGGDETHGTIYGMFNSSQLNARNAFDTTFGNSATDLRTLTGQPVLLNGAPIVVRNQSGGEDSFTFVQG
ncbi:MAG TPA: carboxypeptidase-like regulatory domain-containing protein, partial [Pyrinomonadaceae bacterium]|nr:carboxypeptidase-like regulatory domain-containing protein [Pyrinomonadaceae bacterium]